jgi:hypothetical protein
MRALELLTPRLIAWLTCRGLDSYIRVGKTIPWADIDEVLKVAHIDDLSSRVVRTFLDLEASEGREV